jgi:hypothetical protein
VHANAGLDPPHFWGGWSSAGVARTRSRMREDVDDVDGTDAPGGSADLFGQGDDDAGGAAKVAKPVEVLVLGDLAEKFGAVGA